MLIESSASDDISTIKTWTTFGDASLQLRTKTPDALTLSNTEPIVGEAFAGTAYIDGTPAADVLICISASDNYYSGLTDGSGAYSITHSLSAGDALLVATAFNTTSIYETTTVINSDPCLPINNLVGTSTGNSVTLTWEVPTEGNVTGYNIYRESTLQTTITASLTYTQNSVPNGTYEYCVNAIFDGVECYDDLCTTVIVNDGSNSSCESPVNLSVNEDDPTTHTLSWEIPLGSNNIFDDIESHTAFTINSAGDVPWSYIDGDASTTYSISDYDFTNAGLEMAYIVFNPEEVLNTTNSTPLTETTDGTPFNAYSGSQFLACFNASTGDPVMQTNDWIISPELNFSAPFEFTFQARSGHKTAYPESFKVTYSTTTNAESSFTNILQTVSSAFFEWTEYTYTVPADAKYVAINCNSTDKYYFCVDDIYIGDGSIPGATLTGYNVYCDGVFLGTTTETTYTNVDADEDYHEYCIEATYADNCISPQVCETIGAAAVTYNIVASAGSNGTITPSGTTTVNEGTNQTYNITPNSCYEINDVLVNGSSVGAVSSYTFNNVTSNQTISASFSQLSYNVTSNAGTGGNITTDGTIDCGDDLTFNVDANTCYEVSSVTVNGTPVTLSGNSYTVTYASEDITINATFSEIVYNVAANAQTGGNISANSTVDCGDDLTFSVSAESCYEIGIVTVNGSPVTLTGGNYTINNVYEDITINAEFDIMSYTVNANADAGGNISVASAVNCGDDLVITFVPDACYEVTSATVNGNPITVIGNSYTVVNVSEDITINASFGAASSFTITGNASAGGSISTSTPTVVCEEDVTFTLYPETCYEIGTVTVNGSPVTMSGNSYTITNITQEITINAQFDQILYDVTLDAEVGGNITGVGSTIECGGTVVFSVVAEECYEIESITFNSIPLTPGQASYSVSNITSDVTIEATFTLLTTTITANAGSGGSITPDGNVTVNCGSNQTFTITPDANYIINDVLVDGLSVGVVSLYEFLNVTDNATIIATFQESTGIFNNTSSEINVFPNPANGIISIELNQNESNASNINIMSLDGKIVRSTTISSDKTNIDINEFAPGVYFMNISSENELLQTVKLIKL
jgi:hypothetical protein